MKAKVRHINKPENLVWVHRTLKFFWLAVAIFSILPIKTASTIHSSITVIFFISVYANYVAHWSTERALEAQLETRSAQGADEHNGKQK